MADNRIQTNYNNQIYAPNRANSNANKTSAAGFSNLFQNAVDTITKKSEGNKSMDDIFASAAEKYNVPLNLLKAVAKVESGFDAGAVSRCGALGVMQLMPGTAASLGVQNPLDAEQNIMGGAKYLSQMLSRYNGDARLALAAYNAGSGNVAKYGGVPPFKETQAYISRVMDAAGGDVSAPTDPLSALSSLYHSTSTYSSTPNLNSDVNSIFTYDDYLAFIQLYIAQMQMNAAQSMSSISDISDTSSSGTDNSMFLI